MAILLGVVLIKTQLLPHQSPLSISPGMRISLGGVNWSANEKTLVLALQEDCHFCSESAPFYRRLVQESVAHGSVHLLAVLPNQDSESRNYLSRLGVAIPDIRQAQLSSIHVQGTPTLILVGNTGAVERVWIGQLPSDQEQEVIKAVSVGRLSTRN